MASLSPGQSFGRYEVAALLGEGGMGEVYRARDTKLRRNVALKVIHSDQHGDRGLTQGVVSRFTREAQAAAALAHPNVVTVFDVGEVDGTPFIAMELLDGVTLRSLIGKRGSIAQRLEWLLETAHALAAAHALGLVHRDIKPDNVMICAGHVKVLDFGVAKWVDEAAPDISLSGDAAPSQRTGTGHAIGTPRYMAPEQTRGRAVDASADQFAWGIVAYELLAREHPQERTPAFTRELDWGAPPVSLAELVPELPFGVSAIVMKALGKWPSDRFESMTDLIEALEPIVERSSSDDETLESREERVDADATTIEDDRFGKAITPPPEPPRPRRSLGIAPVVALAVLAIGGVAFITAPTKNARVHTIAPPPVSVAGAQEDASLVQLEFNVLNAPGDEQAIIRALERIRLVAKCFSKEYGLDYLRSITYSSHRIIFEHIPKNGWVTDAQIFGFTEKHARLRGCINGELAAVHLPANLPDEKLAVVLKVVPGMVPPPNPSSSAPPVKLEFGVSFHPQTTQYTQAEIDRAFAPARDDIIACRLKEGTAKAEAGLMFNIVLRYDANGKVDKRSSIESADLVAAFNNCVYNALAKVKLPRPKDGTADLIRITTIVAPFR